jgi:hypothetical protein
MISLLLKVRKALSKFKREKRYIITDIPEITISGINIDFKGVLRPYILPFKRLLDIYC